MAHLSQNLDFEELFMTLKVGGKRLTKVKLIMEFINSGFVKFGHIKEY